MRTTLLSNLRSPGSGLFFTFLLVLVVILSGTASNVLASSAVKSKLAEKSLLLDVVSVEGLVVAVGERGHVLRSEDSGKSWHQAEVPTRATLTGVFFS